MNTNRLLKLKQVIEICAISRPTIYRLINKGEFPAPVYLTSVSVAWRLNEINEWVESRQRVQFGGEDHV